MTRAALSQLDDWQLVDSDQDLRGMQLVDTTGTPIGTIREMIVNTDTEYVEAVVLDDGREIPAGEIEIGDAAVYLRRATPVEPGAPAEVAVPRQEEAEAVIPIVEEEVRVGKRAVEQGGIRVSKRVEEVPVNEQVTLRDETVDVERRRVDRPVTDADIAAVKEGTFEVRERDEEAVVDKQARVVEEVVIDKDVEERTETVQDTVRRTDVDVEELPGGTRPTGYQERATDVDAGIVDQRVDRRG